MKKILFVVGTRPEAIKMAPLIKEFQKHPKLFVPLVCSTAQHRQMLDQVFEFFAVQPDYDLNMMKKNQTLFDITAKGITGMEPVLNASKPDVIFVQGDTTTAFLGALAGYYRHIPVAHLEAGLRSGDKYSPYPEEVNRKLIGCIADYHFAPTPQAEKNLANENRKKNVWTVGNTVIDALMLCLALIKGKDAAFKRQFHFIDFTKRIILVTGHRRESFGEPFENICTAFRTIAEKYKDVQIVYPVHLNPNVRRPVNKILTGIPNIFLIEPLDYPSLVWLMKQSCLVVTDSGGIQEEAPSLGKPVLVTRDVTERVEGINAGTARLVGTSRQKIIGNISELLENSGAYNAMANATNPYGDGTTSKKIVQRFIKIFCK
jgi:UDP-N-acetylglucosamine 2-epimerase (non-hydrolysing)